MFDGEWGILEHTPFFDLLTNDAYENRGCVRSIGLNNMPNAVLCVQVRDKIITIGQKALGANYLKEFGLDMRVIASNSLLKN